MATSTITAETPKTRHAKKKEKIQQQRENAPVRGNSQFKSPMSSQVVFDSNQWMRDLAKGALGVCALLTIATIIMGQTIFNFATKDPDEIGIQMDAEGRVASFDPVVNASLTQAEVLNWAADRIRDAHTFTFTDYADHVYSLRQNYTDEAFQRFQQALIDSLMLDKIKRNKLLLHMEPLEAPKVTEARVVNGVYTWVVEMPIKQIMEGGNYSPEGNILDITVEIRRTSRTNNLSGVVISKYLAKERA